MIDPTDTLDRLFDLEEQAILKAGPSLDRPAQILEGRRRVAIGAAWLLLARGGNGSRERRAFDLIGFHLRQAQQILDRELAA